MREIKLRAWIDKQMLYPDNKFHFIAMGKVFKLDPHIKENRYYSLDAKPIVMQFTGLTDKNGKDIYEGDIVRILYTDWVSKSDSDTRTLEEYLNDKAIKGVVKFKSRMYLLMSIPNDSKMSIHCGQHGFIEVIGDIHTTPELLK